MLKEGRPFDQQISYKEGKGSIVYRSKGTFIARESCIPHKSTIYRMTLHESRRNDSRSCCCSYASLRDSLNIGSIFKSQEPDLWDEN